MSAWTTTSAARNCIQNMTTSHDKQNGNCGVHFVLHFSFSNHWESNVARRVLRSWRTYVCSCLLLFLFYCCARKTTTVFLLSKIQIHTTSKSNFLLICNIYILLSGLFRVSREKCMSEERRAEVAHQRRLQRGGEETEPTTIGVRKSENRIIIFLACI